MDSGTDSEGAGAPAVGIPDLIGLCRLLNESGVQYLVYGGLACLLHGHERMTRDADIYVGPSRDNIARALDALKHWGAGYARELTVDDVLTSVVVRINDVFVLDLASEVWKLEWPNAWEARRLVRVGDVCVPVLSRADLIRSKATYREQDKWDVAVLSSLEGPEPGQPARWAGDSGR